MPGQLKGYSKAGIWMLLAAAGWAGETPEHGSVSLEQIVGPAAGLYVAARWDITSGKCELCQANPDQPRGFVQAPMSVCTGIRALLKAKRAGLGAETIPPKAPVPYRYGNSTVLMTASGLRVPTTFAVSESCDASFTHCIRENDTISTRVAAEIRARVSKELGLLPPIFGRD